MSLIKDLITDLLRPSGIKKLIIATIFLALFSQNSFADSRGFGRTRTCNAQGEVEGLNFNRFDGGKDSEFILSNPACVSAASYAYSSVKIAIALMNGVCGTGSSIPRVTPSLIQDSIDIIKAENKAKTNQACAVTIPAARFALLSSTAMIFSIYQVSNFVFKESRVCGSDWIGPNTVKYNNTNPVYKKKVQDAVESYIAEPTLHSKLSFSDKYYREWYYNGQEVEDNPDSGDYCPDVSQEKRAYQRRVCVKKNGFACDEYKTVNVETGYPPQVYYMRGLPTGNFNCKKYDILPGQLDPRDNTPITSQRLAEYRQAFNCCKARSENYICIEYLGEKKFCRAGTKCEINGVHFEAVAKDNNRLVCAQTYSLCPYNFYLGGGAETCEYFQDGIFNNDTDRYDMITVEDVKNGNCASKSEIRNPDCTYNAKAGKCKNYCQYMKHCTITNSIYQYRSQISSAYFSQACLNFIGDSQNRISYGTGFVAGSARHFSAPIAQCTKETLENIFYNRAGHHRCLLDSDAPDTNGDCDHGTDYRIGDKVKDRSFFEKLQSILVGAVKMTLTLSIAAYGMKILIGAGQVKKEELILYIAKIGLVMYFATGSAWQTMFFDGVYSASTVFAQMVFKIETSDDPSKRDGCQFGKITDSRGEIISASNYPRGKEYLAIWDTFDCKIARYMGFGPEISTANIAKLILAGFLTGAPGIYFSVGLLIFGLVLISAVIRAIHIFLSSSIAILIMVYVSPITILCSLFTKTQGIFKGWVTQIIAFTMQPMILFTYLAIFISIMDTTLIGSATFYGEPPHRLIHCKNYCTDLNGHRVTLIESQDCSRDGDTLNMPKVDSFACMINVDAFDSWPGLELIGISLPFIIDLFTDHTKEKILTILKAALVLYFLNEFMGQIPSMTTQLLGGAGLGQKTMSARNMFGNISDLLRGIQKRGVRGGKKLLKKASAAKKFARAGGENGKAVKEEDGSDATDSARKSPEGSADSAHRSEDGEDSATSTPPPKEGP